jgi:hypothetical protein
MKSASIYGLVAEWKQYDAEAFNAAKLNGWYVECLAVMTANLKERMKETQKKKSWSLFR